MTDSGAAEFPPSAGLLLVMLVAADISALHTPVGAHTHTHTKRGRHNGTHDLLSYQPPVYRATARCSPDMK